MPVKRYMDIGRVALVNYGKDYGKLGVFVDVIDQNQATIGTPQMVRRQMNFKRRSPILRLKLAVLLSEISLQAIPMSRSEIDKEMNKENIWKKIKAVVVRRILAGKAKNGRIKY
ncbi:60S ribosomal protein L14-2-like [Hevea brasiliensis]|uniref:60S ribosomal protein L14-2-like n=1 Tax=Hevea brasiliensis TaxID=3981 RepID=UPI0025E495E1|nr:60S ribosomal protein L14-2-like [Hevea brasiliensis]